MKAKIYDDPIVAEVARVKKRLAAKFNGDVAAMLRDAQKRQKFSGHKVVFYAKAQANPLARKIHSV